jgi:predicted kinase
LTFEPPPARLVAVGGFSGTGKTTLAAALAPDIGANARRGAPALRRRTQGAVRGRPRRHASAPEHYDARTTARVYRRIVERARAALQAGHSVIADAVFARPDERQAFEEVARQAGAAFTGIWLSAPATSSPSGSRRVAGMPRMPPPRWWKCSSSAAPGQVTWQDRRCLRRPRAGRKSGPLPLPLHPGSSCQRRLASNRAALRRIAAAYWTPAFAGVTRAAGYRTVIGIEPGFVMARLDRATQ